MERRVQRRGLAFFVLALLVVPAAAYPDPGKAPRYFDSDCFADHDWRFVHDFVGLFDEVEGGFAEERACALYELTAAHLVLAAVPDLEGESLEVYALHLFEAWGIGDDERLDGILVLYAEDDGTDSGSGALRIEVGYGLESTIVASIAREAYDGMVELKARQVENGSTPREATAFALAVGTAALADYLIQAYDGGFAPAKSSSNGFGFSDIPWWVWLVVAVVVLSILAGGRRGRGVVFFPPMGRGGGGLGRGGSGGRGGGGFGGGRSGGGGWGGKF